MALGSFPPSGSSSPGRPPAKRRHPYANQGQQREGAFSTAWVFSKSCLRLGFLRRNTDPPGSPANRSLCLVNPTHSFFIHPATVHFDFRESSFDLTKVRMCELNIDCSQVLVQVIGTSCTGNRNNERLLREQPGQ